MRDIRKELLQVHGDAPSIKSEGVCRILYENANGIPNQMQGNRKLRKAKELINDLKADVEAYNEHHVNLTHWGNINGFRKLFQGGTSDVKAIAAHNKHHCINEKVQEGGTCLLAYGSTIDFFQLAQSGKDDTGLGQWVYMTFAGTEGFRTRIICGYNPCFNSNPLSSTSYQQHKHYWLTQKGIMTCPRVKF